MPIPGQMKGKSNPVSHLTKNNSKCHKTVRSRKHLQNPPMSSGKQRHRQLLRQCL